MESGTRHMVAAGADTDVDITEVKFKDDQRVTYVGSAIPMGERDEIKSAHVFNFTRFRHWYCALHGGEALVVFELYVCDVSIRVCASINNSSFAGSHIIYS